RERERSRSARVGAFQTRWPWAARARKTAPQGAAVPAPARSQRRGERSRTTPPGMRGTSADCLAWYRREGDKTPSTRFIGPSALKKSAFFPTGRNYCPIVQL